MKANKLYKAIEFFLIFIVVPVGFTISFPVWIKMSIGLVGFCYIIYILMKIENKRFKIGLDINWKQFWKHTLIKLVFISILTFLYVYYTEQSSLFNVVLNKPLKWLILLFVYSFFSVYPQELIYRTFYFQRYKNLVSNQNMFLFINAIVFALAHLFFKSTLVLVLTFFGGLLFALTFNKTKSTLLVSIEHAIYGCWLFTVGMGEMLGFPT